MTKVLVCGLGGIGSYFIQHIDRLIDSKQINDYSFTCFDDDVVENKNILYQNFEPGDIGMLKTTALQFKFLNINYKTKRVDFNDLIQYNLIILCADNNLIRRQTYDAFITNKIPFIDARANGKTVGIFSSATNNYLSTIDTSSTSQSCQNPFQIEKKQIEFGNVIIAAILTQIVLNFTRTIVLYTPNHL